MSKIVISPVLASEIDLLRNLCITTFLDTYGWANTKEDMDAYLATSFSSERLNEEIETSDCHFYFARLEAEPVGYIKLNYPVAQTEKDYPNSLEIERIYVLKAYQGKKIGKALMDKAIEVATIDKISYLWLGVWERNPKAVAFYEKQGFVATGTHIFKLGNDLQTDIVMKKIISEANG